MSNKKYVIISLLVILSLIPACSWQDSTTLNERIDSSVVQSSPDKIVSDSTSTHIQDLIPLQGYSGWIYGASSEDGFYYVSLCKSQDGSLNIHYIDYSTMTDIYLCNQPNCQHIDESCTSWIPYIDTGSSLMAVEDQLIIVHPGSVEQGTNSERPQVEVANLDGSARRNLIEFSSSQYLKAPYLTDGKCLYACLANVSSEGESWEIVQIDLSSDSSKNQYNSLFTLDPSKAEIIWSAFDSSVLIRRIDVKSNTNSQGGWVDISLIKKDLQTNQSETLLQWNNGEDRVAVFGENIIHYSGKDNTIRVIDAATNNTLYERKNFLDEEMSALDLNIIDFRDEHLLVSVAILNDDRSVKENQMWALDIKADTINKDYNLFTESPTLDYIIPVQILSSIDSNNYFVLVDQTSESNNSLFVGNNISRYGKISKEKYWKGESDIILANEIF